MHIKSWHDPKEQLSNIGRHTWSCARLFELSKDLPVMDVPLKHMYVYYTYEKITLRDMVTHINAVNDADLDIPIILDEDGDVMDGRHRLMKAMLIGAETIKVRRFDVNPSPCQVRDA
jgi:hypothetical protein